MFELVEEPNGVPAVVERRARVAVDVAGCVVVLALFVAAQLALLRASILLTRPLWLDELHTVLIAGAPSLREGMRMLAAGVDFNLPAAYLVYRVAGGLTGGISEVALRTASMVCVLGALGAVYLILREQFTRFPAAVGVLAVWAQPVVVHAAFDARFYGPWLLATGCLLLAVRSSATTGSRWPSAIGLAVASIATCGVHYLGVLSWGAGVGVMIVRGRHSLRETLRRLSPAIAGPLALLAFLPLYVQQRSALSAPTWIPAVSVGGALFLLAVLLLPPSTVAAALFAAVERLRVRRDASVSSRGPDNGVGLRTGAWLLIGQAVVPLTLAVVSLIGEPLTQPRYWIVGAFAAAPIAALAVSRAARPVSAVITLVTLAWSIASLGRERDAALAHSGRVQEDVELAARFSTADRLVVVRRRHTLYPVLAERRDLRLRTALLDASSVYPKDQFLAVERDVARVHERELGYPRIVTPDELAGLSSFHLIEFYLDRRPTSAEFPHHTIRAVAPRVFLLERQ